MSDDPRLEKIRAAIDQVDDELLALISKRAALAAEVREIKSDGGKNRSFYRPEREARILRRIIDANPGPMSNADIARLFREIISACLALEQQLAIAYLGPEGTFTQAAAIKHFGHAVETRPLSGIDQVFREVESGQCDFGVVPIENSIEGVVNHTHDLLLNTSLRICGEVEMRINQNLMSKTSDLNDIKVIYSHQQSFGQCRGWLEQHLKHAELLPVSSNAEAARLASEHDGSAAIASESAAETYGLAILAGNIEDDPINTTRFLVIGDIDVAPSGNDKTSLIFSTTNKPGALYDMLVCFSDHGVSMSRIESRPSRRGMWDYVFFVDLEGHAADPNVAAAMHQLENNASMVKFLGSYPCAVT